MTTPLQLRIMKTKQILAILVANVALLCASRGWAATYYSQGSVDPTILANWNSVAVGGGTTPANFTTTGDIFVIQAAHSMTTAATWTLGNVVEIQVNGTLTAANAVSTYRLTVNSGGLVVINSGITLTVNNASGVDLNVSGTVRNAGTITMNGTGAYLSGGLYRHDQNGGAIPAATWNAASTCEIIGVTTTAPTGLTPSGGFGHFTWNCSGQSATLNVNSLATVNGNFTVTSTGSGTLQWLTATGSRTVNDLNISGGTFVFSTTGTTRSLTVNGDLNISGGTFDFTTGGSGTTRTLSLAGSYNQTSGTFQSSGNTVAVSFTGVGKTFTQSGGTLTTANMDFSVNSGASLTLNNNISISTGRTLTVAGTLSPATGSVLVSGAGTLTGTAGIVQVTKTGDATDDFAAQYTISTKTLSGLTVEFIGASAQKSATASYGSLKISNASGVTLGATTTASGDLTISSGATLDVSASNYGLLVGGNWANSGTFNAQAGTVTFNGTAAQAISGASLTPFFNLTIANTTVAVSSSVNLDVTGTMTVNANATFSPAAAVVLNNTTTQGTLTGSGTIQVTRAATTADLVSQYKFSTRTLTALAANYAGAGDQTVNSTASVGNYGSLTVSGSGTKTLGGAVTVNGDLTIAAGTLTTSGNALSASGNLSVVGTLTPSSSTVTIGGNMSGGGTLTANTSTFIFNGAGNQTIDISSLANDFYNLTISKSSGAASLTGNATVGGALTITQGEFIVGNFTIEVTGATSVSGTLTISGTGGNKTFTGDVTINNGGTWNETAAEVVAFAGNLQNDGAFTALGGSHTFSGNKTIGGNNAIAIPAVSISNIRVNNGTLTVSTTIGGSGTLQQGAGATLNFGGTTISPTLTATAAGNTVNYNGTAAQTVKATTYSNLILNGGGGSTVKSMGSGIAVNGNLSIAPTVAAQASIVAGQNLVVNSLTLGGAPQVSGTWGSTSSSAVNQNNTYFAATTGILTVGATRLLVTLPGQTFTSGSGNSGTVNNQTAGTSFNITLTAVDANNNIDTSYSGSKTINYSGPGNAPGGATPTYTTTVTFTAGQATGVATTLRDAGTTTITATDGTLTGVASSSLTVDPATATKLGFGTQPSNTGDAAAITPAVTAEVQDTYGNVVISSTAPVTVAIGNNPASGVLRGTLTVNAVSGVATFSDLHIWEIGSGYTLTASSSPLTGATSSAFDITQAIGDYRSTGSGTWATLATWERWDGSTWVTPAPAAPTAATAGTIGSIIIQNGHVVTAAANAGGDQMRVEAGGQLTISGGTFTVANGTGTDLEVFGTVRNASTMTMTGTGVFQSGGKYQHNFTTGASVIPTATWATTSTCEIVGYTTGTTAPTGLGQSFGNFTWNCPSQTGNINLLGTLTTVNGDLSIVNMNTATLRLASSQSPTLAIGGNLSIQQGILEAATTTGSPTINVAGDLAMTGGTLDFSTAGGGSSGTVTLNVSGNVSVPVGATLKKTTLAQTGNINFAKSGTQTFTSGGTISGAINWTVNSTSTVDLGISVISGTSGTFTLSGSGGLISAHASGLDGNITVTGTKTFSTTGNYTFNGSVAQVPGSLLPATVNNLTIDNAAGVAFSGTITASGTCTVNGSSLFNASGTINGPVTVNGTLAPAADGTIGTLTLNTTPTLAGTLSMDISKTANSADNVTRSGGGLTYGGTLNVANLAGTFVGGESYTLFTASSYGGSFSSVSLPPLAAGLAWDTSTLANSGKIEVYAFTFSGLTVSTPKNTATKLTVAKLLAKATTARGTKALGSVSGGVHCAVSLVDGDSNILITPETDYTGTGGSFTCVLTDGHGSIVVTVNVTVTGDAPGANIVAALGGQNGNTRTVVVAGMTGVHFDLEEATDSAGPYTPMGLDEAVDGTGIATFVFTETATRYYRSKYLSGP